MPRSYYDVSDWERSAWRLARLDIAEAEQIDAAGERQFAGFRGFGEEVYHRLTAAEPRPLPVPAGPPGDVFGALHAQIDGLPEVERLRARCGGDEYFAGTAATCVLQQVVEATQHGGDPIPDPVPDEQTAAQLAEMLRVAQEDGVPEEGQDALRKALEDATARAADAQARQRAAADAIDPVSVRQAVRAAARQATSQIQGMERAVAAFGFGSDPHAGAHVRRDAIRAIVPALRENDRLRRIAELAGRLRRIAGEEQRASPHRAPEEVVGIELGREIDRLLPAELAVLDDPDAEDLFYLRYAEGALQQVELSARPKRDRGPIVFLLDSSGSMASNGKDAWAAAVALAFLDIAVRQRRAFVLVHFGKEVLWVDAFLQRGDRGVAQRLRGAIPHPIAHFHPLTPESAMNAVSFFAADGGTAFGPPLDAALAIVTCAIPDADIVLCTDGLCSVSQPWIDAFNRERAALDARVYALLLQAAPDPQNQLFRYTDRVVSVPDVLRDDATVRSLLAI